MMTVKEYAAALSMQIMRLADMDSAEITQDDIPDMIPMDVAAQVKTIAEIEYLISLVRGYVEVIRAKQIPQVTFKGLPLYTIDALQIQYHRLLKDGRVRPLAREDFERLFGREGGDRGGK